MCHDTAELIVNILYFQLYEDSHGISFFFLKMDELSNDAIKSSGVRGLLSRFIQGCKRG